MRWCSAVWGRLRHPHSSQPYSSTPRGSLQIIARWTACRARALKRRESKHVLRSSNYWYLPKPHSDSTFIRDLSTCREKLNMCLTINQHEQNIDELRSHFSCSKAESTRRRSNFVTNSFQFQSWSDKGVFDPFGTTPGDMLFRRGAVAIQAHDPSDLVTSSNAELMNIKRYMKLECVLARRSDFESCRWRVSRCCWWRRCSAKTSVVATLARFHQQRQKHCHVRETDMHREWMKRLFDTFG